MTEANYPTRSLAAAAAKRSGLRAFECIQVGEGWEYEIRADGAGVEYAIDYAGGKDYISHIEMTRTKNPVIVVTCFPNEIDDDLPSFFKVEPVTPSMLDAERPYRPLPPGKPRASLGAKRWGLTFLAGSDSPSRHPITGEIIFTEK